MDKTEIRKLIIEKERKASKAQCEIWAQDIIKICLKHPRMLKAKTILFYEAMPYEVPTRALMEAAWKRGVCVCLPKMKGKELMPVHVKAGELSRLVRHSLWPVWEPVLLPGRLIDASAVDVVIVPGRAFDKKGYRVGHGQGIYDRFLPHVPHAYKIGLAYPYQMVDAIDVNEHDVAMDEVIT